MINGFAAPHDVMYEKCRKSFENSSQNNSPKIIIFTLIKISNSLQTGRKPENFNEKMKNDTSIPNTRCTCDVHCTKQEKITNDSCTIDWKISNFPYSRFNGPGHWTMVENLDEDMCLEKCEMI